MSDLRRESPRLLPVNHYSVVQSRYSVLRVRHTVEHGVLLVAAVFEIQVSWKILHKLAFLTRKGEFSAQPV